jgi:hypothetical protein
MIFQISNRIGKEKRREKRERKEKGKNMEKSAIHCPNPNASTDKIKLNLFKL